MPYEAGTYRELSSAQIFETIRAYGEEVIRVAEEFEPDLVHIHHLWVLIALARGLPNIPCVVTVHGTDLKQAQSAPQHRPVVASNIDMVSHFLCVSKDIAQDATAEYRIGRERTTVIGNGYDPEQFKIEGARVDLGGKVILCAGKLVSWKGFRYAVEACARLVAPRPRLVILGDGGEGERKSLQAEAKEAGVSLILPGHVSRRDVAKWMRRADVFVLPSIHEPFGLVLLEALACGRRVVAADSGGPKELVSPDLIKNGLGSLVAPLATDQDEERYVCEIAAAIQCQLEKETPLSDSLLIAASVRDRTWRAVYERIRTVYLGVTKNRG